MVDIKKAVLHTSYDAFKNNNVYTGSFNITGSATEGANVRTSTINLPNAVDLADITFNGPVDPSLGYYVRPADGWTREGYVKVRGDDAPTYVDYATHWAIYVSIAGTVVTFTAVFVQQFAATLSLTTTAVNYRIVDYSVF